MNLPLVQPYRGLLYGFLALWAALLILGFAFGQLNETRTNRIPLWNRMGSSLILVACALIWWQVGAAGSPLVSYARLICFGMAVSFLGDLIMARVIPLPERVIFGMLAFGIAHVCYIFAYLDLGQTLALSRRAAQLGGMIALWAIAGALWWLLIRSPQTSNVLNAGSLIYALLLATMTGMAVSLAVQQPRLGLLALGAILFLISDVILGNELFRNNVWPLVGDVVWVTYIVGQALIVFSTATALRLMG